MPIRLRRNGMAPRGSIGVSIMRSMTATTPDVSRPVLLTSLPGPKAAAWIARDDQVLSPSYTRAYPLVAARGAGCTIEDVDGNLFLDFTAGIAVTATGHCHPEVTAAIIDQAGKLVHMSGTDFYYTPEIELAERLARLARRASEAASSSLTAAPNRSKRRSSSCAVTPAGSA